MFSTPSKKSSFRSRKNVANRRDDDSTPVAGNRRPLLDSPAVPNRPASGTPAPWASRLSVLARVPPAKRSFRGYDVDAVEPVYVGKFPQVLRIAQMTVQNYGHVRVAADASVAGGMDKETSLAWIICGNGLLSSAASRKCINIDLTSVKEEIGDVSSSSFQPNNWLVRFVNWDSLKKAGSITVQQLNSAGIILCNKKTGALLFWPDISNADRMLPFTSRAFSDKLGNNAAKSFYINSLITSPVSSTNKSCIALACSSNGELWRFFCSPSGIQLEQIEHGMSNKFSEGNSKGSPVASKGYPRSLIWQFPSHSSDDTTKQFLLLTNHEIQCYAVKLSSDLDVVKLWTHEIIGVDGDLDLPKNLAGQKRWPLDLAVDSDGKVIFVLIAFFCTDRVTSSSCFEYSLQTMQYKSGVDIAKPIGKQILEKKDHDQFLMPKARVEDEEFLFSMRLKVGGKPAGSAIVVTGDGTATVSNYRGNSTKLFHFDLPIDAGKVLDASVFPSLEESEDGTWVVLTEKAGVWVEPPERSLSRKWSSNDGSLQEERSISVSGNIAAKRASPEAWETGDRQRGARRSPQDEESEYLLSQLFHEFLLSGQVDGVLDKLKNSRAFEREGEINVFARMSKSIVDTLAKHWTTTRGSEIPLSVVSTQLVDKQQKHQRFLQFLALSKCHEELCHRQRQSMQIMMEHGEKLASMIQLRELLNATSHATESGVGSDARTSGALWDLIHLVGERARRNTVLLMDRDNAEVFYSKVSELEDLFHCLEGNLEHIITQNKPIILQSQRACELANACVTIFRAAVDYRADHHLWYPPPEGLTLWYSNFVVWSGLWNLSSFMLQLLSGTERLKVSIILDFYSNLVVLSEILLESYFNAITAKVDRKEDHRSLLEEYSKCRDTLLDSLYKQVKYFIQVKLQDSPEEKEELNKDTLMTFSSKLLSIAKRHEGYQTMWNICYDLNDFELLHESDVHENIGPKGGFSCFVFKQLYDSKQLSKLMRLGEEFPDELATILRQHPDLLWLHELFLRQFSSASETLHALSNLSLPKDNRSVSDTDETEPSGPQPKSTLARRKHFLILAKLSAMAGREVGDELKVKRIEADLNFLQVQEEIVRLLHDDNKDKQFMVQQLLDPLELIRMCLKINKRELSLRPFDIFFWMSASFLRSYAVVLEECWRNAASQDDWKRLYGLSMTEGWSDERTSEVLEQTVLFHAARKCYGPHSKNFNVKFDEVLPLRSETIQVWSVEDALMMHKDYFDSGKLMLTAILLGSV
ncbi:nucleoporin [Striga asiatica]|uniref:Nucleoporin n=1 Tax=Striga asiatica TaxID=4170 RepID=A0A5A7Q7C3_STRAF|nr:nucleoporin [Striga asiatica]